MSDFKKIAIYVDTNGLETFLQPQENRIEYFQQFVDMYNSLNTGVPLQKNDLTDLIRSPKDFIAQRLIKDETVSFGGLKLSLEKVFDIIEKPTGTDELINKIISDNQVRELMMNQRNVEYFEIENENRVVINDEFLQQTQQRHTVYIKTENEAKAYKALQNIAENINKLNTLRTAGHLREVLFEKFLETNEALENVSVNPYFGNLIL
jgi:hypothetical protein